MVIKWIKYWQIKLYRKKTWNKLSETLFFRGKISIELTTRSTHFSIQTVDLYNKKVSSKIFTQLDRNIKCWFLREVFQCVIFQETKLLTLTEFSVTCVHCVWQFWIWMNIFKKTVTRINHQSITLYPTGRNQSVGCCYNKKAC